MRGKASYFPRRFTCFISFRQYHLASRTFKSFKNFKVKYALFTQKVTVFCYVKMYE